MKIKDMTSQEMLDRARQLSRSKHASFKAHEEAVRWGREAIKELKRRTVEGKLTVPKGASFIRYIASLCDVVEYIFYEGWMVQYTW